ncbi:DUF547 domain-containing protein [Planctomycetota bacterium]
MTNNKAIESLPVVKPVAPPTSIYPALEDFYRQCNSILTNYVNDEGLVDYPRLRRQRFRLEAILKEISRLSPNAYQRWEVSDRLAFWINTYNLNAMNIVAQNYPLRGSRWMNLYYGLDSLRHLRGYKNQYKFLVMDEEYTLMAVEQRIFRKQFSEPLVLFALTQQTLSGPRLLNAAYRGAELMTQLNEQAQEFILGRWGIRIDHSKEKVSLSALLLNHSDDFLAEYTIDRKFKDHPPKIRAVLNFASAHTAHNDSSFLETGNYLVDSLPYDWTVNSQSR